MPNHDGGIGRRFVAEPLRNYGVECGRRPSMLKMKSWSAARIIFTESRARKREIDQSTLLHVESRKTAQFSVYRESNPRASRSGVVPNLAADFREFLKRTLK
ncbi:uncharacterized protein LOC112460079 [Temnothorax curvispinosus]|uniref:Uncharacterized protein LOC112460079 n=1 Tax=Temnothorax curvispinosus TaxID=300111 RepID=A0A6J1QDB1_9HYME|nr:uncharacterized protein LOC112460079 [Temnothorax curvispinosus]